MPVDNAYKLYERAGEPKKLIIADGMGHSDRNPFFSSAEKERGAIRLTLNWLEKIYKK